MNPASSRVALDGRCSSAENPWSVLDVSASNAQLAGVLAGFMILALVTLLTIKKDSSAHFLYGVKHATVLLGLGTIILGLDAYLFGAIAATRPPEIDGHPVATDSVCQRAWGQFVPAAGLLTVGAMTLVAGLTWMIVCHSDSTKEACRLAAQSNWALTFVAVGSLAFLAYDATVFIDEMHNWEIAPSWMKGPTLISVWVIWAIFCTLFIAHTRRANKSLDTAGRSCLHEPYRVAASGTPKHVDDPDDNVEAAVRCSSKWIIGYLVLAIAFTIPPVLMSGLDRSACWGHILYFFGVILCIAGPALVFCRIAKASPGMNLKHGLLPANDTQVRPSQNGAEHKNAALAALIFVAGCAVGAHLRN
jgi:hypothetical protein